MPRSLLWRQFWFYLILNVVVWGGVWWLVNSDPKTNLTEAVRSWESKGQDICVGDRKLKHKAYGPMQIRQPCLDDVNRIFAKEVRKKFGKKRLTTDDVQGNRALSDWLFEKYTGHYATRKRLGRAPTDEDRARIWNGGPNGWKKKATRKYWQKVKEALE